MGNKEIQDIDSFIETLMRSYLGRRHIKDINELSDEEINGLFNEMKKVMSEFSDYNDRIDAALIRKKNEIIDTRKRLKSEQFIKSFRKDRSSLDEGLDPEVRLKTMGLENFQKRNISVNTSKSKEVIKINPSISKVENFATLPLKDALKVEKLEPFSIVNEGIVIEISPKGSLKYNIDTIEGNIQKYRLYMKDMKAGKIDIEYIYTNPIDEELYKKDKMYREKLRYLLSQKNIKNSKKLDGYLGEITIDNRVVDDPVSYTAILKHEQDIYKSESKLDKLKRSMKGNKNDGR